MNTILICLILAGIGMLVLFGFCIGAFWDANEEAKIAEELEALIGEVWHEG